jgi:hypothetical protein
MAIVSRNFNYSGVSCLILRKFLLPAFLSGNQRLGDLYYPALTLFDSAATLLQKTDGDLAGWLGDLAPRGDLDSTQLLYRLVGANMADAQHGSEHSLGYALDVGVGQAFGALTMQGLPLLALAFRMLKPAVSSTSASKNTSQVQKGDGTSSTSSTSSSSSTSRPRPEASGNSMARSRTGLSFTEAWVQSPNTLKTFVLASSNLESTARCMSRVRHMEAVPEYML